MHDLIGKIVGLVTAVVLFIILLIVGDAKWTALEPIVATPVETAQESTPNKAARSVLGLILVVFGVLALASGALGVVAFLGDLSRHLR